MLSDVTVCLFYFSSLPRSKSWEKGGEQTNHSETQPAAVSQRTVQGFFFHTIVKEAANRRLNMLQGFSWMINCVKLLHWMKLMKNKDPNINIANFLFYFLQTAYLNITLYFNVHTLIIYFNQGRSCESDWFVCGRPCGLRVIVCDLPSGSVLCEALWSRSALSL